MEKVFEPKAIKDGKQFFDEYNGKWLEFPNHKLYLLPVVRKTQKLVPVFCEDGSVKMEVSNPDKELADHLNKFMVSVAESGEGNQFVVAQNTYQDFILLVRRLLATNYSFGNQELASILTMTSGQFAEFFSRILTFIR